MARESTLGRVIIITAGDDADLIRGQKRFSTGRRTFARATAGGRVPANGAVAALPVSRQCDAARGLGPIFVSRRRSVRVRAIAGRRQRCFGKAGKTAATIRRDSDRRPSAVSGRRRRAVQLRTWAKPGTAAAAEGRRIRRAGRGGWALRRRGGIRPRARSSMGCFTGIPGGRSYAPPASRGETACAGTRVDRRRPGDRSRQSLECGCRFSGAPILGARRAGREQQFLAGRVLAGGSDG